MSDGKPSSNLGCVLALIAFPFVVLIGIIIGLFLRDTDEGPTESSVTLEEGDIDGTVWRVDAEVDVEGATCVFSYLDDAQSTGACSLDPQDDTIGDRTIVFGRAATDADQVTVELSNGESVDIDTTTAEGMDGRFYVQVVEGDVNTVSLSP